MVKFRMVRFWWNRFVFFALCALLAAPLCAAAGSRCAPLTIAPRIEVPPRDFTAADLLPPNACPALVASAARIRLGAAPLEGIARVFVGREVRLILARAAAGLSEAQRFDPARNLTVPERVIVRRAPARVPGTRITGRRRVRSEESSGPGEVRPGQTATLVWDGGGIRVAVPVTCLDRGSAGESVRARIVPSGTIVRAVVVQAGVLRASS